MKVYKSETQTYSLFEFMVAKGSPSIQEYLSDLTLYVKKLLCGIMKVDGVAVHKIISAVMSHKTS